jgi:hypothetical protein
MVSEAATAAYRAAAYARIDELDMDPPEPDAE